MVLHLKFLSFIDVNHCVRNPCQNGGSCSNLAEGHKCSCIAGYTGRQCKQGMCKDDRVIKEEWAIFEILKFQPGTEA